MTNIIDNNLIEEIRSKHGDITAQAIIDYLGSKTTKDEDLQCMEVLQMSEISCRFRSHIREMISEYRDLQAKERMLEAELFFIKKEQKIIINKIRDLYSLYRNAYADFMFMFDRYMSKISPNYERMKKARKTVVNYGLARTFQSKMFEQKLNFNNNFQTNIKKAV